MSKKSLTVYIGRFSIAHNGHFEVLLKALKESERVLVLVGSADRPRTIKNPWTAAERSIMLRSWYNQQVSGELNSLGQLLIEPIRDFPYNDSKWIAQVQDKVRAVESDPSKVWLTGCDRDDSSWYLQSFSYNLNLVEENREASKQLSATRLRHLYFGNTFEGNPVGPETMDLLLRSFVPSTTREFLETFKASSIYANLVHEYEVNMKRRAGRKRADGYAAVDLTVDSVVVQNGHVLLVKRRNAPGKGLWAFPGGYVDEGEWTSAASFRELDEETKIKVPPGLLRGSLKYDHWFEHPDRSLLGRTVTHAFCYVLPNVGELPKVKGMDDAEKARWFSFAEVLSMCDQMFDDHYDMFEYFLEKLGR